MCWRGEAEGSEGAETPLDGWEFPEPLSAAVDAKSGFVHTSEDLKIAKCLWSNWRFSAVSKRAVA